MERVQRGFRLLRASWEVLKKDRELIVLPVVSGLITVVVAGSFVAAAWGTGGIRSGHTVTAAGLVGALLQRSGPVALWLATRRR